jgi:hypothetical protein
MNKHPNKAVKKEGGTKSTTEQSVAITNVFIGVV